MKRVFFAKIELLHPLLGWLHDCLAPMDFDSNVLRQIELACEEAFVNIIQHAYQGLPEEIEIEVTLFPKSRVEITFKDHGPPFNPLAAKEVDPLSALEEKDVGGLGIHLIRKLMDEVRYNRIQGLNVLILIKKFSRSSQRK